MTKTHFPTDRFESVQTPFYYYDLRLLDETLKAVTEYSDVPGFCVHYAVKANANPEVMRRIAAAGLGADTVSIGEIHAAVDAGFPAPKIVFAGVGKTDEEIRTALELGIGCFNVESEAELDVIEEIAASMDIKAPIALRVNPEIDAHTHHYITTGLAENKFGIAREVLPSLIKKCLESDHLQFKGLHFHIGSQITDLTPYKILCERILELQKELEEKFPGLEIPNLNVGGGLGIDYDEPDENPIPDFKTYFDLFKKYLPLKPGQKLHFELGRAIVAQCGSLICKVVFVKEGLGKRFVILDGGMAALIRPALYQAHHKIENISSTSDIMEKYDVVGPICESSDTFGVDELLPLTRRGDYMALRSAGAYGEVMASCYNCRPLPASLYSC
ncbi:MAG: diaminopimelate decarboxylase [Muribaculaceae bacterium]|nr:diaminopimelate decarboxylase [Muribaculaceae bacterium]